MPSSSEVFLIEIQQRMTGDAVTPLKTLEDEVNATKAAYTDLAKEAAATEKAMGKNATALAAAKEAEAQALAKGDTGGAEKAAAKVAKLTEEEERLKGKAEATTAALAKQGQALDHMATEYVKLKGAEEKAAKAAEASKKHLEGVIKTGDGLEKIGGPIGLVGGQIKRMAESFKSLKEGGSSTFGAIATMGAGALSTLAVAAAAAGVAVAGLSIAMLDSHRDMQLTLEAMFQSGDAASMMTDAFSEITQATGVTSDRLLQLTRDLKKAKVSAEDIPHALGAIAEQESALGDTSGTADLIKQLESGKKSVGQLQKEMDDAFGDIAGAKAIGLSHAVDQIKDKFLGLIEDVDIEPILDGIDTLIQLLDRSSESGEALQLIFKDFFAPLEDGTDVFTKIEGFILDMEIGFLQVDIAVRKVEKSLGFDLGSLEDFPDLATVAKIAGGALAVSVVAIAAGFLIAAAAVDGMTTAVKGVVKGFEAAKEALPKAFDGITKAVGDALKSSTGVGTDLIAGIAKGITDDAQKVIDAITGVVNDAITSAKTLLGIKSPSKVFAGIGENVSIGFAEGIDAEAQAANDNMRELVAPPEVRIPPVQVQPAATAAAPVFNITININGSENAREVADQVEERLQEILERWARQRAA